MSVSKNWDTNLLRSEKKTLRSFLALYSFLCFAILSLLGFGYYNAQKNEMLQQKRSLLNTLANEHVNALKYRHINIDKSKIYPRDDRFRSAIFDESKEEIFSLLSSKPDLNQIIYVQNDKIFYIKELSAYYLGTKYLVLQIPDDKQWLLKIYKNILWFGVPILCLFLLFGYMLLRVFLKPMKEAIALLDRFIKDTTHELNTPISTILSNIELIDNGKLDSKEQKRLKRINIGARTVSNLYQDLVYLTLGQKFVSKSENLDLKLLFEERLEYFSILFEGKNLRLSTNLTQTYLYIDKVKITKLIDNLISNAIKYNKPNGQIVISLQKNHFCICNEGKTMKQISSMFKRYHRGDEEVGGFGIGLSIVYMVADEYDLKLSVSEHTGGGTCVKVCW